MKPENILNALNDMDYDMVEEAEMEKKAVTPKLRVKKTVLIAAAVCLLLCGTAAAAGIFWMKPEVQINEGGMALHLNGEHVSLPEKTVQTIIDSRIPERGNKSFFTFDTLKEWQEFFALPFVSSSRMTVDESPKWVDHGTGILVPEGTIDSIVTMEETGDGYNLCLLLTAMNVEWYKADTENTDSAWKGSVTIHVPLNERAAKEGSFTRVLNNDMNAEILSEYTTPAGIPCIISRIVSEHSVTLYLYYGYESVMYELEVRAVSPEEEAMRLEDLKEIADTLEIRYTVK